MTTTRRVSVTCPCCHTTLAVGAVRLRAGASLPCPDCHAAILFDAHAPAMAAALEQARKARRARRDHLAALQQHWRFAPAEPASRPDAPLPDVGALLAGLDTLLHRLDDLILRQR